jgi:hypothetical protein
VVATVAAVDQAADATNRSRFFDKRG